MDNIKIKWLDVSKIVADSILVESNGHDLRQTKIAALNQLGITCAENEKPLQAWIKSLCRENGYPETVPAPREIADAILTSLHPGPKQFMFWLA